MLDRLHSKFDTLHQKHEVYPHPRKVDIRRPGKGNSNSHDAARPVHLIVSMIKWTRTSRLSPKFSLSGALPSHLARTRQQCDEFDQRGTKIVHGHALGAVGWSRKVDEVAASRGILTLSSSIQFNLVW